MKILHVTKKYPNALGGDGVVVSNLQRYQQKAGHDVTILTSNCNEIVDESNVFKFGLLDSPASLDNITIKRLISLVALPFCALRIVRKYRPDVIHTHSVDMAFFLSFIAYIFKVPIVHTFHIVTFNNPRQAAIRRLSEMWLAKGARPRSVTAPNVHDVLDLKSAGLPACTLPNGVDLSFWKPEKNMTKEKEFLFVSVGRLEEQKGYKYLVKATAILVDKIQQPFRIVVVGEGSQKSELQKLAAELGIEKHITLAGRKSPSEIRNLMSRAHAAVFPSLYETTPITLLEAWAVGLPAISTQVGILQDDKNADKVAFIAQVRDEESLSNAMVSCMASDSVRQKKAQQALRRVQQYSWQDIARSAEVIYRGIA